MKINSTTELINILSDYKIVIYGAGYVATRFYRTLVEHNLSINVSSCVTTTGGDWNIDGLPGLTIDQLKPDDRMVICLAVHESIKEEIITDLVKKGFTNYIWIYPFLYELMLGLPTLKNAKVPLSKIWNAVQDDYCMAVRYLALDNYYKKNTNGYEIYKRYLSLLFNSEKTSEKRLKQFIGLIKNWEDNGYDISKCCSIFENYKVFDGVHRISVASYFDQDFVMCDIYPMTKSMAEIHNQGAIFNKKIASESGFEPEHIKMLEATNRRIEEQYKWKLV